MFKMFQFKNLKIILVVLALIAVGAAGAATYFYNQYQTIKKNPDLVYKKEDQKVIVSISEHMQLPQGEEPSIATILDITKLKGQRFFENAQNGDKIITYTQAKKAILWRPSTNKIIEVASLVLEGSPVSTQTRDQASSSQKETGVSVALYNGTNVNDLAKEAEKKIAGISDVSVVSKANAAKNNYGKTLVVDLTGKNGSLAMKLADVLSGEVSQLPAGEAKPAVEILIIAGENLKP